MPKVLITGSSGQLGSELRALSNSFNQYEFVFADRTLFNLNQTSQMETFFTQQNIAVIINCAAYTNVDKAEEEVEAAEAANHEAVAALANIALEKNISLVHISTDYVFDGSKKSSYLETDETNPINVYGKSKCSGERVIQSIAPRNSIIIRTSWVFSEYGNNFVKTMLKLGKERESLGVIYDQIGSPTYAKDLAYAILEIIPKLNNAKPEIYHFTNEGETNWYDFAKEIFSLSNLDCKVNPLTTEQYPTKAKRPPYSLMSKGKIKHVFDLDIRHWKDALKECLNNISRNQ